MGARGGLGFGAFKPYNDRPGRLHGGLWDCGRTGGLPVRTHTQVRGGCWKQTQKSGGCVIVSVLSSPCALPLLLLLITDCTACLPATACRAVQLEIRAFLESVYGMEVG